MSENFEWQKPENTLQSSTIRDALDELLKATENKIQREWPPQLGSGDWHSIPFLFFLKNARWTYVATLDLLADKPEDKKWHLEYAVVIPPLNRTILDMVFNCVFIFDDFADRVCWYFEDGEKETQERLGLYKQKYSNNPEWAPWFTEADNAMLGTMTKARESVSRGEAPVKRPMKHFPHPGGMLDIRRITFKVSKNRQFLTELNDWLYKQLSGSSHSHWAGLAEKSAQILRIETSDPLQREMAKKYKSDCVMTQITLLLCLVSEIIHFAGFDNRAKAAYVWGVIIEIGPKPRNCMTFVIAISSVETLNGYRIGRLEGEPWL